MEDVKANAITNDDLVQFNERLCEAIELLKGTRLAMRYFALKIPFGDLIFSRRTANVLDKLGVRTMEDAENLHISDILRVRGAGKKVVKEIVDTFGEIGIVLDP